MPEGNEWEDDDAGGFDQNPQFQKLRQHTRDLEKERKGTAKELEELRAFKVEAEARAKEQTVRDIVSQMKLPAKVAGLYRGDATPEAVAAWAKEYGDVFGIEVSPEAEEAQ